jgi:hypothetical protein
MNDVMKNQIAGLLDDWIDGRIVRAPAKIQSSNHPKIQPAITPPS